VLLNKRNSTRGAAALRDFDPAYDRSGSNSVMEVMSAARPLFPRKADVEPRSCDVANVPKNGCEQSQQTTPLFDHLVGSDQQPGRHREAQRLCRFDIESRYKFRRRLHWEVGRLSASQNAVHVVRRLPKLVHPVDRVRHETAGGDEKGVPLADDAEPRAR